MKWIRRTMVACITILTIFSALNSLGFAEESSNANAFDLPKMSMEDILALRSEIEEELYNRGKAVVLTPGEYLVGRDVAAGSYTLTPYNGEEDYRGWSWSIVIYRDSEAKAALARAEREYWNAKDAAKEAEDAGKEAVYPKEIDNSTYKVIDEAFTNIESTRVVLEEGQVLQVDYWRSLDETIEVVISKVTGLFMN